MVGGLIHGVSFPVKCMDQLDTVIAKDPITRQVSSLQELASHNMGVFLLVLTCPCCAG